MRSFVVPLLSLMLLACSRDEPTPPAVETDAETGAETGPDPTVDPSTTGVDDTIGDTTEATTLEDSSGAGSESGGEDCVGRDGCFDCTPTQSSEFLNHCTNAACAPFENTARRLPRLEADGSLPPIP